MRRKREKISLRFVAAFVTVNMLLAPLPGPAMSYAQPASDHLRPTQEGTQRTGLEEALQEPSGLEDKMEVYLNPRIKEGKLEPGQTPFWKGAKLGALWRHSEVKAAQSIAIARKKTQKGRNSPYAQFSLFGKTYATTHRVKSNPPPELLMVVDIQSRTPTKAFLLGSGEKVFSLSDERFFRIYLDPPMDGGQLVEPGQPFLSSRIVAAGFWDLPQVRSSREVVIDDVAAINSSGWTVFRVGLEKNISINHRFDPAHPMKLRVVMDPKTRTSLRAYDMATSKEVYSAIRQIRIYLDPVIRKGRVVSFSGLFRKASNLQAKLWDRIREATQKPVALDGVPTFNRTGQAIFFVGTKRFKTTRAYSSDRPLRLLVIVDPRLQLPSVAYDRETGERVYRFDRRISVYLDPSVENGKLKDPGEPLDRISVNNAVLWERADVKAASVVALEGVTVFDMRGKYAFAFGGAKYRTPRDFDASRSLRLLVLADPATHKPITVFDQETGEKLYDSQEKVIGVFLDPKLKDGRRVSPSVPYKMVRMVGQPLWKELVSKAEIVGFSGVRGYHQKRVLVFSVSKTAYKTDIPLALGSYVNLFVVARTIDQVPIEAFILETGQKIYPPIGVEGDPALHGLASLAASKQGWVIEGGEDQKGPSQAGLEEQVVWKVENAPVPLSPVKVTTAADGVTVPIGEVLYPNDKKGKLKLTLPDRYRQKEPRDVMVSVDHQAAQIYPRSDGRLANGWIVKVDLTHEGRPVTEWLAFTGAGAGFVPIIPGVTPIVYVSTGAQGWLDRSKVRPIGPVEVMAASNGYTVSLGKGVYPDQKEGPVRLNLPRERYAGRKSHSVILRVEWKEQMYPQPDGRATGGYALSVTADSKTDKEQTHLYQFTGQKPGLVSLDAEMFLQEVADVVIATHGDSGALLDALLVLHGERFTPAQLKEFVRRYEELNLGELVDRQGRGGKGRGSIFLEFFFQQAGLVNQKEKRDRDTLIQVFLKVVFRELVNPKIRDSLLREVQARRSAGIFFEELANATEELVLKALVYQPNHLKTRLLPHQRVASYFLSTHPQAYCGDFTGLGKTIEALGGLDPTWKVFVAAPAGLVDNWRKEIRKHMKPEELRKMKVVALHGTPEQKLRQIEQLPEKGCICIGSIQGLRFIRNLPEDRLKEIFNGLDLLIVDESQFGANWRGEGVRTNAQQAEALQVIPAPRRWYLSATGYGSNPSHLFATLAALTRGTPDEEKFRDYRRFVKLHPPAEAAGLRYLRAEMRARSISREADEVMDRYEDPAVSGVPLEEQGARLPNLVEVPYRERGAYVLNDEQIRLLLLMIQNFRKFADWYNERVPEEQHLTGDRLNPFTKLRFIFYLMIDPKRVGGETESPLWPALDQVVDPYLDRGKKGILYVQNRFVTEELLRRYGRRRIPLARIDGTVTGYAHDPQTGELLEGYFGPDGELVLNPHHVQAKPVEAKTHQRDLFQNDPAVPLSVVGIRAGGIGMDLTAAELMVEVQPAEVFTQERQMRGRPIRPDLKRPRLKVDEIRMTAVFPDNFTAERIEQGLPVGSGLVIEPEYRELAARLAQSGTPTQMALERLKVGEEVFRYVMTDLATDEELDLFDPASLAEAIPGFMQDPTMEEYLASLSSERLRETLRLFLPLYEASETREKRQEVLQLAELFYRTGQVRGVEALLQILPEEDESAVRLISSLLQIPNRYARSQWLTRAIELVTQELPAGNVRLSDVAGTLDFLEEEAPYLAIPLYWAAKGYDNGGSLAPLTDLLAEAMEATPSQQKRRLLYQQFALWLLAVGQQAGLKEDPRDALREVLEKHGALLNDRRIPLEERLAMTEGMLRLISFPLTKRLLLEAPAADGGSFRKALDEAAVGAARELFDLSEGDARRLAERFPGILTAIQIQGPLKARYPETGAQFSEVMLHIAQGDYASWRNEQAGPRLHGERISFLEEQPDFWRVFTREEMVPIDAQISLGFEQHWAQLQELFQRVEMVLSAEESASMGQIEGEWTRSQFQRWLSNPKGFRRGVASLRKNLAEARRALQKEKSSGSLTPPQRQALQQEGLPASGPPETIVQAIEARLREYDSLEEWLLLMQRIQEMSTEIPPPGRLAEIRTLLIHLSGRASQAKATKAADHIEQAIQLMARLRDKAHHEGVLVQFTTDPSFITERGMLNPYLTDCFNCYANPDQTSALADELGSRNKILALVWDKNKDHILARAVLKVKRTEQGTPVLFPERPLHVGGYNFEPEILEAIRRSKMEELSPFGARLAREGKPPAKDQPESRAWLYETGGYGDWEYFEPLFKMLNRKARTVPIHHRGELLTGLEELEAAEPVEIEFLGSVGYQQTKWADFVGMLRQQRIQLVVDVREVNFSYRPEYSKTLEKRLRRYGIRYLHMPSLGAPKEIRGRHELGKNDKQFMAAYARHLGKNPEAIAELLPQLKGKRACLLCYEANPEQCHRLVIAQEIARRARVAEPVIDLRSPLLHLVERSQSGLEERRPEILIYLDPRVKNGYLQGSPIPFMKVRRVPPAIWKNEQVQKASTIAFYGRETGRDSVGGKWARFRLDGKAYLTKRLFNVEKPLSLLIIADPREKIPVTAYDQVTGELVYEAENRIGVYLNPDIKKGRLVGDPTPFRSVRIVSDHLWLTPEVREAAVVALANVRAVKRKNNLFFHISKIRFSTNRAAEIRRPLSLLVLVNPQSRRPMIAYDLQTGETVYDASASVQVYLDPPLQEGRLVGNVQSIRTVQRVQNEVFSDKQVKAASKVVLGNFPTHKRRGGVVFNFFGRYYRTARRFDLENPLSLLLVVNARTRVPLEAYDFHTAERVFPHPDDVRIYLDPSVEKGKLVGDPRLFMTARAISAGLWKKIAENSTAAALVNILSLNESGWAIFQVKGHQYRIGHPYSAGNPMKLTVIVNSQSGIPIAAYDMATGEQVYSAGQVADQLKPLADLATSDGEWVTGEGTRMEGGEPQAGLEEMIGRVLDRWAEAASGTAAYVISPEVLAGPEGDLVRRAINRLPPELAGRVYQADEGGLEEVAVKILQQVPEPEQVWVVGSAGTGLISMLKEFGLPVKVLAPGAGLEEFLARLGLVLGVPSAEVEAGLEEIQGVLGLAVEA